MVGKIEWRFLENAIINRIYSHRGKTSFEDHTEDTAILSFNQKKGDSKLTRKIDNSSNMFTKRE